MKSPIVLAKDFPIFNNQLKLYANESLKKSIKKIEDQNKEQEYKIKLIVAKAFNEYNYKKNNKKNYNNENVIKILIGATTISFSLYLVYSFLKT
jgi:hypothetical protein